MLPGGHRARRWHKGQPARHIEWEEAIGEEARVLLWAPYPNQYRYLLFAPSFLLLFAVPKPRDLRRCVTNEDDAAATLSHTYFRGALDVSNSGFRCVVQLSRVKPKRCVFHHPSTALSAYRNAGFRDGRVQPAKEDTIDPFGHVVRPLTLGELDAPEPIDLDPTANARPASCWDHSVLPRGTRPHKRVGLDQQLPRSKPVG
jgi:hypothetical protein